MTIEPPSTYLDHTPVNMVTPEPIDLNNEQVYRPIRMQIMNRVPSPTKIPHSSPTHNTNSDSRSESEIRSPINLQTKPPKLSKKLKNPKMGKTVIDMKSPAGFTDKRPSMAVP